jgi:glycosyltransferase involved in cell wall biosynthesis
MNILFVLYGGFDTNSANPLVLYARELDKLGHSCTVAVPGSLETVKLHENIRFHPILFEDVLANPGKAFANGRPADIIHACTPREVVRIFITEYMRIIPTPWVIYLEDNEEWISERELELDQNSLARTTTQEISDRIPAALSHPFYHESFTSLADSAVVIQDKLQAFVPPWVPTETVMLGVDLEFFTPVAEAGRLRELYAIKNEERVLVYHGGMNKVTRPAIKSLCEAVGIINQKGFPCRLLRTGPKRLDFLRQLPGHASLWVSDLGVLPKNELPGLLSLADVYVQPGAVDPFEDLRLPGKVPEFLAMGRPVIMPDVNIAHLFDDGINAVILRQGTVEEIAEKCIELFQNPDLCRRIGKEGRRFAEQHFDVCIQAKRLEDIYKSTIGRFKPDFSKSVWQGECLTDVNVLMTKKLRLLAKNHASDISCNPVEILDEYVTKQESSSRRIKGLEERLAETVGQNKLLDIQVAELVAQVKKSNIVIQEKEAALAATLSSTSWRVTRPLRMVKELQQLMLRNLKKVVGRRLKHEVFLDRNDYSEWVRRYDTLTEQNRTSLRTHIKKLDKKPLVSILMPTYNPNKEWLVEAIESVRKQIYPFWELCIADDASDNPDVHNLLDQYVKKDERIKVVFRDRNGHISAASNSALALANGQWIALLDHDDLLSEHALYWVVDAINKNNNIKLIYSDEDKINADGVRQDAYFKSDWNPDLFHSQNMITHLGVYHIDLLKEIGGFRTGYEGAQDYDLALRYIERIAPEQIHHIPRVLYHWRTHDKSTSKSLDAKPYGVVAGEKALSDHFNRLGIKASVTSTEFGYKSCYALPSDVPLVSIIIPTRNSLELIRQCIASILELTTYSKYEILIIDNDSDDAETLQYLNNLTQHSRIRVLRDERPFNYSELNNEAVKHAKGEFVLLLNNDIEVISPDWISEMVGLALQEDVGAVGARLWYPDNTLQHGGVVLGTGGVAGHAHKHLPKNLCGYFSRAQLIQSFSAVTAACLLIRKKIYIDVGGLNETDLKVAFNDVDFCLRVREAGYRNIWTPYAELYHHESASRGFDDTPEKLDRFSKEREYMVSRWGDLLLNDPAYSPNLSLDSQSFELAWPPRIQFT